MGSGDETNDVYVQYSLSGNPQGPYSPPQQIVSTIVDPTVKHLANGDVKGDYNYGFQPYPQFFGDTAQEVLVSWDYGYGTQIQMAKLTFDP